jgi:preprotein translocase subunit SecG
MILLQLADPRGSAFFSGGAESFIFTKFYTNFTENFVTLWVLLCLLLIEAGI